jgi:hypothetical protein
MNSYFCKQKKGLLPTFNSGELNQICLGKRRMTIGQEPQMDADEHRQNQGNQASDLSGDLCPFVANLMVIRASGQVSWQNGPPKAGQSSGLLKTALGKVK